MDSDLMENLSPVFILGMPRSGTTMLASMLAKIENVYATPESQFIQWLINTEESTFSLDKESIATKLLNDFQFKTYDLSLSHKNLVSLIGSNAVATICNIVKEYAHRKNEDSFTWIEHTPENYIYAHQLLEQFPSAKFIIITRDPRGCFESHKKIFWGEKSIQKFCYMWSHSNHCALAFLSKYPQRCMKVQYETLLDNPESNLSELLSFIDVDNVKSTKTYKIPTFTKSQHSLVNKPLDRTKKTSWQNSLSIKEINFIEYRLYSIMPFYGYNPTQKDKILSNPLNFFEIVFDSINGILLKITGRIRRKYVRKELRN